MRAVAVAIVLVALILSDTYYVVHTPEIYESSGTDRFLGAIVLFHWVVFVVLVIIGR